MANNCIRCGTAEDDVQIVAHGMETMALCKRCFETIRANFRRELRKGEDHHSSKLTEEDVREIRFLSSNADKSNSELAEEYGVSDGAIWRIVNGETWTHVTENE